MKSYDSLRATFAIAGLTAAQAAHADGGGITNTGWISMLGVVGIVGILYVVYKKMG